MRIRTLLLAAAAVCAVLWALQQWREREQSAARRLVGWEERQRIRATETALDRPVELTRGQLSLDRLAVMLGEQAGIAIDLDQAALSDEGIVPATTNVDTPPGTFSLRAALHHLLRQAELWYEVRDGRVVITTPDRAESHLRIEVYPLPQPAFASRHVDAADWAELIRTLIQPQNWDDAGGTGHIEAVPGAVVIVQTDDVHREVARLLTTLSGLDRRPVDFRPVSLLPVPESPQHRRILDELNEPAQIACQEFPLDQLAAFLSKWHRIPVLLDGKKLEEAGVSSDTPVTKRLSGVSLRSALNLLLSELELTFMIRDETLLITTPEAAESELLIVLYPVHDLVTDSAGGDYEGEPLVELITTTVAPQSWDEVGGPSSLSCFEGWLVIPQTLEVHAEIELLLGQLRQALFPQDSPAAAPFHQHSLAEMRIRAALDKPIALKYDALPLQDVAEDLSRELGINVVLVVKKLEEMGISSDTPITCDFAAASLRSQLLWLLAPLNLTYVVRDDVLAITTPEDAESRLRTRLYDVRTLADPELGLCNTGELCNVLTTTIASNSWDEVGGPGSIEEFRGLLVVSQVEEVNRQVAALLAVLEEEWRHPSATPQAIAVSASPTEQRILALLDQSRPMFCEQVPLARLCDQLTQELGVPVLLNVEKLQVAGVAVDEPMTCDLPAAPLRGQLRLILSPLGLDYEVRSDLLVITTADDAQSRLQTWLYDVRSLVGSDLKITSGSDVGMLLTELIEPQLWEEVGGPGSLGVLRQLLVVSQTEQVHQQIRLLLAALAELRRQSALPASDPPSMIAGGVSPATRRIERLLSQPIRHDFCGEPMDRALSRLARDADIPLVINWKEIYHPFLPPVTLVGDDVTLGGVLDRMLAPLGLCYVVRDDALVVTSQMDAGQHSLPRLYHVADLAKTPVAVERLAERLQADFAEYVWNFHAAQCVSQRLPGGWLLVSTDWATHQQLADWLAEQRTGQPPPRAREQRELAEQLDYWSYAGFSQPAAPPANDPFVPVPAGYDPFAPPGDRP